MTQTFKTLMAVALVGGASFAGTAALPAGDAQSAPKTAAAKRLSLPGHNVQAARLAQRIKKLEAQRRLLAAKIRALRSGRYVAVRRLAHDCQIVRTSLYRARLQSLINRGLMNAQQASQAMGRARTLARYCQIILRPEVRRLSAEISRLKVRYSFLVSRHRGARR